MAKVEVKFSVTAVTRRGEILCMVGDSDKLGNWDPQRCQVLRLEKSLDDGLELWSTVLKLSPNAQLQYRYFIAHVHESEGDGEDKSIMVRYWETNLHPRSFSCQKFFSDEEKYSAERSTFGHYGGKKTIDKGWLTTQTEIHIRLHGNPINMWKSAHRKQSYRVKCTTLDIRHREMNMGYDEDESNHDLQVGGEETHPYISILDGQREDSVLQPHHGSLYREDDYMIFKIQTHDPEFLGYQFDFFVADPHVSDADEEDPKYVGTAILLPLKMKHSNGQKNIPINGLKHKPIGELRVEWLINKPLVGHKFTMQRSFHKYWKARQPLDVGHRGMGSTYGKPRACEAVRENTIHSLSEAGRHGSDFVEFDVQLSKDKVPIVYHDFTVNLTLRKRSDELDWFEIAVRDLNLCQLQMLKLDHVSSKNEGNPLNVSSGSSDSDPMELQIFPTLRDVYQRVDSHLGFAVELKYPVEMKDGSLEEGIEHYFDRNTYCDIMCRETLQYAANRRVMFLSFDPDICTLMRLKQNIYPVFMLTQGKTERYGWYADQRTWSTRMAYSVARSERFLGVSLHSEEVLKDKSLIELGREKGLVLLGWGEEFDQHENVKICKELGLEGVIYDKVQEFTAGKENVFKLEREAKEIYKQFNAKLYKTTSISDVEEKESHDLNNQVNGNHEQDNGHTSRDQNGVKEMTPPQAMTSSDAGQISSTLKQNGFGGLFPRQKDRGATFLSDGEVSLRKKVTPVSDLDTKNGINMPQNGLSGASSPKESAINSPKKMDDS